MQICLGQQLNLFHICHLRLVSMSPSPERGAAPPRLGLDRPGTRLCLPGSAPARLDLLAFGFPPTWPAQPFPCKSLFWSFDTLHYHPVCSSIQLQQHPRLLGLRGENLSPGFDAEFNSCCARQGTTEKL